MSAVADHTEFRDVSSVRGGDGSQRRSGAAARSRPRPRRTHPARAIRTLRSGDTAMTENRPKRHPARRACISKISSSAKPCRTGYPHRDADGQHAVLQHDAQPAAAAYRCAFLRHRDRMGKAADELALHTRADDRHLGQRHHRRHHHRQSRHDRRDVSPSALRGRHHARRHRNRGEARIEIAPRCGHRRLPSPRLQAGRHAGGANAAGRPSCASVPFSTRSSN